MRWPPWRTLSTPPPQVPATFSGLSSRSSTFCSSPTSSASRRCSRSRVRSAESLTRRGEARGHISILRTSLPQFHSMRFFFIAARPLTWTALFLWALAVTGCAVQTQALREHPPADLPHKAELDSTPFFAQTAYQCGPAALATVLAAAGFPADAAALGEQ